MHALTMGWAPVVFTHTYTSASTTPRGQGFALKSLDCSTKMANALLITKFVQSTYCFPKSWNRAESPASSHRTSKNEMKLFRETLPICLWRTRGIGGVLNLPSEPKCILSLFWGPGGWSRCEQDLLRTLREKPSCLLQCWVAPGHPSFGHESLKVRLHLQHLLICVSGSPNLPLVLGTPTIGFRVQPHPVGPHLTDYTAEALFPGRSQSQVPGAGLEHILLWTRLGPLVVSRCWRGLGWRFGLWKGLEEEDVSVKGPE